MSLSLANLKSLLRASLSVAYCTLKGPQLIKPILGLEKMPMPVVYRSVDSVLEVLEDKQVRAVMLFMYFPLHLCFLISV